MEQQVLLHGILEATIFEVDWLSSPNCCPFVCKLVDKLDGKAKLYATIEMGNARVGKTRLIKTDTAKSNPQWCESFRIYCAHKASNVAFALKKENPIGAEVLGRAYFPATKLLKGEESVEQWLNLIPGGSRIRVKLRFSDVSKDENWSKGIKSQHFSGVPFTFFPQRTNCRVTLYQDAHVPEGLIPKIPLSGGVFFSSNRCWEDIFDAIYNAKHFVYITGWSVCTKITLIRDERYKKIGSELTLGQLLKKKAKEGVRVLMLVWDDRTSVGLLKDDGVMATHDENTAFYFENTGVKCVLCPRNPDNGQTIVQDLEVSTMFTHHQKTVVVDSEVLRENGVSKKRQVVSFVGGIDLCDGRYDTPSHSIFGTLDTFHRNDFHQPNFRGASAEKGGPREPWHDIHCKLEGPIALDVLLNFEQRWKKQAGKKLHREFQPIGDGFSRLSFEGREAWNVQLFRSIDGGAAIGLSHPIERSIQEGYITAIRRAKSFIYIENQYFLGSSFAWKEHEFDEVGAWQLVPKELSLKIVSKIENGERFAVYVVIPMWPEGVPESGSVQAILHWQKMTIEMMYKDIAKAIKENGVEAEPKDYLSFFCLGNRDARKSGECENLVEEKTERARQGRRFAVPACFCGGDGEVEERPERGSDYRRAQKSRRFMIYVHAKMMIGKKIIA